MWLEFARWFVPIFTAGCALAGDVTGVAVDPSDASVVTSKVFLSGQGKNTNYETVADQRGHFQFTGVVSGTYRLNITAPGFIGAVREIRVAPRGTVSLGNIRLSLKFGGCDVPGTICDDFGIGLMDHINRTVEVPARCALDVDTGQTLCTIVLDGDGPGPVSPMPDPDTDFWVRVDENGNVYLVPRNGAQLALNTHAEWSQSDCVDSTYAASAIRVDHIDIGSRICVHTNAGRYAEVFGFIRVKADLVRMTFITWLGKSDPR